MNQLILDNYTATEQDAIRALGLKFVTQLLTKGPWCNPPDCKDWPAPNPTQVAWLLTVRDELQSVSAKSPVLVQEQTLVQGGKLDSKIATLPHSECKAPAFTAVSPSGKTQEWVVDVIPVERQELEKRPGLGRMCYFLASLTKIKNYNVCPLMESSKLLMFEVYLFDLNGTDIVCRYLAEMFRPYQSEIPEGLSGHGYITFLYRNLLRVSEWDYLGLHSTVLSYCLKVGQEERASQSIVTSSEMNNILAANLAKAERNRVPYVPVSFMTPIDNAKRTQFERLFPSAVRLKLVGYWTGDLYANRKAAPVPTDAYMSLTMQTVIAQNRGGSKGALSLL